MRQNTKVVVASSASAEGAENQDVPARGTCSAGNSPVKRNTSNTWTTEPWNGKVRRKSIRQSAGSPMKKTLGGDVPPLPGMTSNVTGGLGSVAEDEAMPEIDEFDQNGERGRLFVKVVGVKDLELQFPRSKLFCVASEHEADWIIDERTYFALTLDNGLHCVTTTWLELGKNAPIGQEFELVVLNELEFQLTLSTKLEQPKQNNAAEFPKKSTKASAFSRVFTSPKKRKEMEMKEKEEAQRAAKQREMEARERRLNPTAWDLMHNLVGTDGSFARAYISLKEHEERSYGRPYTVEVPCFNEWTIDEARSLSSAKNGRGAVPAPPQRKAPYKIGKLELQLLYVPKPKDATDDDMPKSMNACVRELSEAEKARKVSFEGHLSQQGGDCPVS
jgi:Cell division protein anillin